MNILTFVCFALAFSASLPEKLVVDRFLDFMEETYSIQFQRTFDIKPYQKVAEVLLEDYLKAFNDDQSEQIKQFADILVAMIPYKEEAREKFRAFKLQINATVKKQVLNEWVKEMRLFYVEKLKEIYGDVIFQEKQVKEEAEELALK